MMQAYMSRPSGNWSATRRAFACFILHTVLWICSNQGVRHNLSYTHKIMVEGNGLLNCRWVKAIESRQKRQLCNKGLPQSCS